MTMTAAPSNAPDTIRSDVEAMFARKRRFAFALPALIGLYLIYVFFAFDIAGIAGRAKLENAGILMSDFVSYKTHVTRDNRSDTVSVAIEGESKGLYTPDQWPDWVTQSGDVTTVDLGKGNTVVMDGAGARYTLPGYGVIDIRPEGGRLTLTAPEPLPDFISAAPNRVDVTTGQGRFSYTRNQVQVFRYQYGWELFFFTLDSPFYGKSFGQIAALVLSGDRVEPERSNLAAVIHDVWTNKMWRHGDVVWAIFETILMAFLGCFGAAIVALPLAFFAAANTTPSRWIRFAFRRVFDFVRGVDGLIWTIILSRAFGPGPMTGALAILITDTGSFGKQFSEVLENIDEKQVEGIKSTGANAVQRARFGVIPQITPVLLSQVLYNFESNTRSATIIGAIVGGGIGLLLTQAITTQKDWEEVAYYMVLIILMVIFMDWLSGLLRKRLIKG